MNTKNVSEQPAIVITGTSRGIGFHLAQRFLEEGYAVIGISRSETSIKHPGFSSLTADLADLEQIKVLSAELTQRPIAGLINNAGIHGPIGPFASAPLDSWVDAFYSNLFGAAALSKVCIPFLRERNGFIIFFSGGGGAFPRAEYSAYGVSKCAVIRFSEVLAAELAPDVLVYCVAPGPNRTGLLEESIRRGEIVRDEDFVDFEQPERLCLFLARNRDIRYSGKFIHVMDNYEQWNDDQLAHDAHTLRRIDRRTLRRVNIV
jgi:NAD(P)-dependent dehydrogenase (short-subunit alcohol dehydrogenase family)